MPLKTLLILLLVISGAATFLMAQATWRKRLTAGGPATCLAICLLGICIYDIGYAFELMNNSLPGKMTWVHFEHVGILLITPTWLLLSFYFTGRLKSVTPKLVVGLSIVPVITFLSAQTLGGWNLFHHNPRLDISGPFPMFTYDRGFFTYLYLAYFLIFLLLASIFYTLMLMDAPAAFRKQTITYWVASLMPWFVGTVYNLGLMPHNLDVIPFALSLSAILFGMGFLKFQLLDILPLARDVVFEGMSDGVLVLDPGDRIIDLNACLMTMLPGVTKESIGLSVFEALRDYPLLLEQVSSNNIQTVDLQVVIGEETLHYRSNLSQLSNRQKNLVGKIIMLHDFSPVKQLMQQLEELSQRDFLTGVCSRRYFLELADIEFYRLQRYGGELSLIMLDIDQFKRINDTYGHTAGDAALVMVVNNMRPLLRQSDFIGRFGGEEFFILLPNTCPESCLEITNRLREVVEQGCLEYEGHQIRLTASFGVTGVVASGSETLEELIRCADKAAYEAKRLGGNQVCVLLPCSQPDYSMVG